MKAICVGSKHFSEIGIERNEFTVLRAYKIIWDNAIRFSTEDPRAFCYKWPVKESPFYKQPVVKVQGSWGTWIMPKDVFDINFKVIEEKGKNKCPKKVI
jgi:hypothetical protein